MWARSILWAWSLKMEDSGSASATISAAAAAVAAAVSPKEEMEEKHKELVMDMFEKITDYLNGELAGEGMGGGPTTNHLL